MKRFFCDKCGKCCEKLPALVIDPGLDDGTGKCKFYDSQTNLCTIYDQRPDICNVDKMYSAFASLMSYEEYIDMNTLSRRLMGTQVYSIRKPILKKLLIKSKIIK